VKFDYRALQAKADALQKEVLAIQDNNSGSAEDAARIVALMARIQELEETAAKMLEAENAELREIVQAGTPAGRSGAVVDEAVVAFYDYLRTGEIRNASLSTTDANGGYIVPEPAHAALVEKIRKADPIFGEAALFELTGDTTLILPYKAGHGVVTNATETGARSEQNAPTFEGPTLTCYDYYTDQRASQQYLDSVPGAEEMLLGWIYEDVQEQAGADAVSGDGTTKIKGLFAETSAFTTKLSGAANALANTVFHTAYFALPVKYRANAAWLMNSTTLATVAAYAYPNLTSQPLARQSENTGEWTILGKRVLETDSAPSIGDGAYPVALADIKAAYAVGVHRSTTVLRDPYTAVPKVRFYGVARLGGCAWDKQACILVKSDDA
jgi:HK97 family phage major capsid protein